MNGPRKYSDLTNEIKELCEINDSNKNTYENENNTLAHDMRNCVERENNKIIYKGRIKKLHNNLTPSEKEKNTYDVFADTYVRLLQNTMSPYTANLMASDSKGIDKIIYMDLVNLFDELMRSTRGGRRHKKNKTKKSKTRKNKTKHRKQ